MTIHEFHKGMREHFGIDNPGEYLDELYLRQKKVRVDIVKFDLWVTTAYGDYGSKGFSLADEVEQKFGVDAKVFIASLL